MMKKISMNELGRMSVDEFKSSQKTPIVIILDNVRSGFNIGSVFRTADAFRIESVLLCGITAVPPNREIQKSALGSTESVQWKYFETTIQAINEFKKNGYIIVSVEQANGSIHLQNFKPDKDLKYALVFGNEVYGVLQEVINTSHFCVEIPQFGTKHSFNISVTAGIVLYDFYNKIICL
jgi:23S rRNA (guanosine2251-2'-O)-methyltransferase